jgi:hypothetical protein
VDYGLVILAYETKPTARFKKNSFTLKFEQLPDNHSHKTTDGCLYQRFLIGKYALKFSPNQQIPREHHSHIDHQQHFVGYFN